MRIATQELRRCVGILLILFSIFGLGAIGQALVHDAKIAPPMDLVCDLFWPPPPSPPADWCQPRMLILVLDGNSGCMSMNQPVLAEPSPSLFDLPQTLQVLQEKP